MADLLQISTLQTLLSSGPQPSRSIPPRAAPPDLEGRRHSLAGSLPDATHAGAPRDRILPGRGHEGGEQRMRALWPGLELRVELHPHEPWVVGQLHDLHQRVLRTDAG